MAFKVLLADDSVPAQNMGKKILTDAGYEVLTASNGLEALRKIADTTPDIAILDIFMPGYTGLEICERLRANAATAELPVILTVGKLEPYRPEDGEHVRSNAVIVKPFAVAELTSAVCSLLGAWHEEDHRSLEAETLRLAPVADPLQEDLVLAVDEPPDERLFSGVASAAAGNAAPFAPQSSEAGVYAVEPPLPADEEPLGPESLVFNPDAGHTPFSASVVEPPPADSQLPAQADPFAFTEFDLEPEAPSYYSAEPSPVGAAPGGVATSSVDAGAAPEALIPEDAAANGEFLLTATAAQLAQVEEAGSQAFEELYNSDAPFPLEGDSAPLPAPAMVTPPSLTEIAQHESCEIEPDPEIGMDDRQDTFLAPAPDPELAEVFEPIRADEPMFDSELRLEETLSANQPFPGLVQHPVEASSSVLDDNYTLRPDVVSDPMPQFPAEAPTEAPEILRAADAVENEPPAPTVSPEHSDLVAEVAKVEALLVQMQAVRQVEERTELGHAGIELQQAEVAPVQRGPEAEPELVSSPLEMAPPELLPARSEARGDETSSAYGAGPGLNEAERIHKAVERVFDRFRPLLVAAIVRELARLD